MIKRYETKARMSRIVVHNDTAYFCGQVAKDDTKGIAEQTKTMLEKVDELLASIGSDKTKLLSATVYISNMENFQAMNAVWDAWVPEGHAPARACVQASMSRPELLVEVSVIAAL